jgi:type II secretory pathway pseudopilin PulG
MKLRDDKGMTIVELLIASTILLTCLASLSTLLVGVITGSQTTQLRDKATNIANQRIEAARNLPFDDVGVRYANGLSGNPAGTILTPDTSVSGFTVSTDCTWVRASDGRAAYKKFTVTVSWNSPVPAQVQVTTMIAGHSDIQTSGDFLVRLRYRENENAAPGATVLLQPATGASFGVVSDQNGESFFGQVPVGAASVTVTPPNGYIVDTSTLTSMTVAADAVSTYIVYLQQPAQATVHVTDTSATPLAGANVAVTGPGGVTLPGLVTDSNGNAAITGLLYGSYSAQVSKTGYTAVTVPFTASTTTTSQTVPFRMSPIPPTGLRVRVFDNNGTQLPGATVQLKLNGVVVTPNGTGTTGTNGEITFAPGPNTYSVVVSATNYVTQTKTDVLTLGDSDVLDYYLSVAVHGGNMQVATSNNQGHLASMRVIVSGPSGYYRNDLYSDSSGNLWIYNLVPGSYSVQVYSSPASVATVLVASNQTSAVSISQR